MLTRTVIALFGLFAGLAQEVNCTRQPMQRAGGIGGLLARTDASGSAFYHADGNGNITALIDGSQNPVKGSVNGIGIFGSSAWTRHEALRSDQTMS